jgi:uncharacterized membrane protein YhdT
METVAPSAPASLRLLRYAAASFLTLLSAVCLTFSYFHEGWFARILRVALGLSLPWIVAWIVRQNPNQSLSRQGYWFRLAITYLGVLLTGILLISIYPFVAMFLMDAGLM